MNIKNKYSLPLLFIALLSGSTMHSMQWLKSGCAAAYAMGEKINDLAKRNPKSTTLAIAVPILLGGAYIAKRIYDSYGKITPGFSDEVIQQASVQAQANEIQNQPFNTNNIPVQVVTSATEEELKELDDLLASLNDSPVAQKQEPLESESSQHFYDALEDLDSLQREMKMEQKTVTFNTEDEIKKIPMDVESRVARHDEIVLGELPKYLVKTSESKESKQKNFISQVCAGNRALVKLFFQDCPVHRAKLYIKKCCDAYGNTALHIAVYKNDTQMIQLLLENTSVQEMNTLLYEIPNHEGKTVFDIATSSPTGLGKNNPGVVINKILQEKITEESNAEKKEKRKAISAEKMSPLIQEMEQMKAQEEVEKFGFNLNK